jgi:hypothetical protein
VPLKLILIEFYDLIIFKISQILIFLIPTGRFMVNQKNRSKPIFLIFAKIGQPIFDGF